MLSSTGRTEDSGRSHARTEADHLKQEALRGPQVRPARAAADLKGEIQNKLDSKSELGDTESLRLQMAMERLSKLMTALSNILKTLSDTADGIVQNLK